MKRAGIALIFLLLVGTTATSVVFFKKNEANAADISKAEQRQREVKKAFEERGRLLDSIQKESNALKEQARAVQGELSKIKSGQEKAAEADTTTKTQIGKLIEERNSMAEDLGEARKALKKVQSDAAQNLAAKQKELDALKNDLDDLKSLKEQLQQANKRIKSLQSDMGNMRGELASQKLLLEDKRAAIKEYQDLSLSPGQIKKLMEENARLRAGVANPLPPPPVNPTVKDESPKPTIKTLPFQLDLPKPKGRLTKPLKPRAEPREKK